MFEDPIVNEIRQARDKIAAEYKYDIHRLFAHWRELEKNHKNRLVTTSENAEPTAGSDKAAQP